MRVALAQMNSIPGDFDQSVRRMVEATDRAERLGANLIVFPSTILNGVYPLGLGNSVSYELDMLDAIENYAAQVRITALIPAYIHDGMSGYIEVFLCEDGVAGPLRLRQANSIKSQGTIPEEMNALVEVDGVTVSVVTDGAMAFDEPHEADLTIICATLPFCDEDASTLLVEGLGSEMATGFADALQGWIAILQGVGGYDDEILAGGSFALSPDGTVAAACPSFSEGLVTFDIEASKPNTSGTPDKPDSDHPATPADILDDDDPAEGLPELVRGVAQFVGKRLEDIPELGGKARTRALWQALRCAVRDYVFKLGCTHVAVELDGSLPAQVICVLAVDALGPEQVSALITTDAASDAASGDIADADATRAIAKLVHALGIDAKAATVSPIADVIGLVCEHGDQAARVRQLARAKQIVLREFAASKDALVLGHATKTDAALGMPHARGEWAGDYAPLIDVYSSRVRELAQWRMEQDRALDGAFLLVHPDKDIIDFADDIDQYASQFAFHTTFRAKNSAVYQHNMVAKATDVDRILYMHVERGLDAADIVARGADPDAVLAVLERCTASETTRRQMPFGPVVSLMPFADRGWPAVLGWRDCTVRRMSQQDTAADDFGRLLGIKLDPAHTGASDEENFDFDNDGDGDYDDLLNGDEVVAQRLERMVGRLSHQDQIMGMVGDVTYSVAISGRGLEMDGVMGMPLFSKN